MVKLGLSEEERTLIEEIETIRFGELFNIPRFETRPIRTAELHPSFARLIKLLRHNDIDRVTVHNSMPTFAHVSGKFSSGRHYIVKHKLG